MAVLQREGVAHSGLFLCDMRKSPADESVLTFPCCSEGRFSELDFDFEIEFSM